MGFTQFGASLFNRRFKQELSGIDPYSQVVPAIFVNPETAENEPFSFGGEDKTTTNIRKFQYRCIGRPNILQTVYFLLLQSAF